MKTKLILGSFMALCHLTYAQNTVWPGTSTSANVGIGTTSPTNKLQVDITGPNDGIVIKQMATSTIGSAGLYLNNNSGHNWGLLSTGPANNIGPNHFALYDITQNQPRLFISGSTGYVGLGTTAPTSLLDVRESPIQVVNNNNTQGYTFLGRSTTPGSDSYMYHMITANYHLIGSSRNSSATLRKLGFAVGTNDSEADVKMTINTAGNIGIGTSNPTSQLHLASDNDHALAITRGNGTYGFRIYRDATLGRIDLQIETGSGWESKIKIGEGEGPNTKLLLNPSGGRVGIGVSNPSTKLHVAGGSIRVEDTYNSELLVFSNDPITPTSAKIRVANTLLTYEFEVDPAAVGHIKEGAVNFLNFRPGGWPQYPQVWVGNKSPIGTHSDFQFAVEGKMVAQSLFITPGTSSYWADYVFAENYRLPALSEVESYYKKYRHLPEIPSAKEVESEGINVGKMDGLLLKKIEELTLYVVELEKQLRQQEGELNKLR
jgi:hypothetical protein